jgi:hypothetical protein
MHRPAEGEGQAVARAGGQWLCGGRGVSPFQQGPICLHTNLLALTLAKARFWTLRPALAAVLSIMTAVFFQSLCLTFFGASAVNEHGRVEMAMAITVKKQSSSEPCARNLIVERRHHNARDDIIHDRLTVISHACVRVHVPS